MASFLKHLSAEEIANTVTHGFGLALSVVGSLVLVVMAAYRGDAISIIGCAVYCVSLIALYAASTFYHSVTAPELKDLLRLFDHCGIYILIAGSYTPFGLLIIKGSVGVDLMIAIWAFAVAGIVLRIFLREKFFAISVISYLLMGWIGVIAIPSLMEAIGLTPIVLITAGGIAYSAGVVFFAWKRIRHHHAIFHVFVLVGSILHYAAVLLYVVPRAGVV